MLLSNDFEVNSSYHLSGDRIDELKKTLLECISNPCWDMGTLAVRMDFSISNYNMQNDIPVIDIYDCFGGFINRLRRIKINNSGVDFVANWKKEFSLVKGAHIHTVFYFNLRQFNSIGPNTKLFRTLKELWRKLTDDGSLYDAGYINLIPSYKCDSLNSFQVEATTLAGESSKAYYGTILTKNQKVFELLDEYHQQKHHFDKVCGFPHWISYLAKTEQCAGLRKAFGTVRNTPASLF